MSINFIKNVLGQPSNALVALETEKKINATYNRDKVAATLLLTLRMWKDGLGRCRYNDRVTIGRKSWTVEEFVECFDEITAAMPTIELAKAEVYSRHDGSFIGGFVNDRMPLDMKSGFGSVAAKTDKKRLVMIYRPDVSYSCWSEAIISSESFNPHSTYNVVMNGQCWKLS